jgi:hypothetical protein
VLGIAHLINLNLLRELMNRSYQKVPIFMAPGGYLRPFGTFPALIYISSIKNERRKALWLQESLFGLSLAFY